MFRSKNDALRYLETSDIGSCATKPKKRELGDLTLIKDKIPVSVRLSWTPFSIFNLSCLLLLCFCVNEFKRSTCYWFMLDTWFLLDGSEEGFWTCHIELWHLFGIQGWKHQITHDIFNPYPFLTNRGASFLWTLSRDFRNLVGKMWYGWWAIDWPNTFILDPRVILPMLQTSWSSWSNCKWWKLGFRQLLMCTKLCMSTSHHPQTDGQSERIMMGGNLFLRHDASKTV